MGGVRQELVFRGDVEILEAVRIVWRSRLVEMRPNTTDRHAEICSNAFSQKC